ncbi:DNA polymerase III subunit delta [Candidatus Erwinia haradaeae]|uniref:DNA polymerase III subunit delta n=1 Tax=Candidatus Erwinia haradaeae TaxID=1922217 RepID=A0A803FTH5_9GAMM|nr:DNA polymerase III subunit delta [Candidatus Erwinia haradaeae]VFP87971.1 DNA polymerase III subunit delta [Candidatus Erwinia haradaeae]
MIKIYPDQLNHQLDKKLQKCYILYGQNPLFTQEVRLAIRKTAENNGFTEHLNIVVDNKTDWQRIFSIYKELSLFSRKKTLFLTLPARGLNSVIRTKLITLTKLLHSHILLILEIPSLTKIQENEIWYKTICENALLVICQGPEHKALPFWITSRAKKLKLKIDSRANKLLCYCYEGNLLALSQTLDKCAILWPNGQLTSFHIKQVIHNAAHFTIFDWISALFLGNSQRALRVLRQIRATDSEPLILLRSLQHDLILLVNLKRKMIDTPLPILFNQYSVWKKRRILLDYAIQRMSITKIANIFKYLTQIELLIKEEHNPSIWIKLEMLTLMFSEPEFPFNFDDNIYLS